METTKNEEIKAYIKPLKRSIVLALFILFLALLFSCEKDEAQTTTPPPEDLIEKSSRVANLITSIAVKNSNGTGCIQFKYPISFSSYDTEFQILATKTVQNDRLLFDFIESLQESMLVSLNFPIALIENDNLIEVNSNTELINTLDNAPEDCITNPSCSVDNLLNSFTECPMYITSYDDSDIFNNYKITFEENKSFRVTVNNEVVHNGAYDISQSIEEKFIIIFVSDWEEINNSWTILDCENFSDHKLINRQNVPMQLQGCDYTPITEFDCFENFIDLEICTENLDTNQRYDLTLFNINCYNPTTYNITYYATEEEAKENINPISDPENFAIKRLEDTTVYFRIELIDDASSYNIYTINLEFITCEPTDCSVENTRNSFTECPIGISQYNDEIAKFEEHRLVFDSTTWELSIFVADNLITRTNYRVIKKQDGTFFLYINTRIPALMGMWLIDECGNFQLKNLIRGNDVMSLVPACP